MSSEVHADSNENELSLIPATTRHKFFEGIEQGDISIVEEILHEYPTILSLTSDKYFCDFLHLAAMNNQTDVCKILLNHGAFINKLVDGDDTPLHIAILYDADLEIIKLFLSHGSDLKASNVYGDTPLLAAASSGTITVLVELLSRDDNQICHQNIDGHTALHALVNNDNLQNDSLKKCIDLLVRSGVQINTQDTRGSTVLHAAVWKQDTQLIQYLLLVGIDPCIQNDDGDTFLHVMENCCSGDEIADFIHDLMAFDENESRDSSNICPTIVLKKLINIQNNVGQTPFHSVLGSSQLTTIELLLKNFVDISLCDRHGKSYLHTIKDPENLNLLLKYGADLSVKDVHKRSALFEAEDDDVCRILLSRGADPNEKDKLCLTPLHLASILHAKSKIKIEYGADVNATDIYGSTPLHFACWWNFQQIADILISYGADMDRKDFLCNTPGDIASVDSLSQRPRTYPSTSEMKVDIENADDYFSFPVEKCLGMLLEKLLMKNGNDDSYGRFIDKFKVFSSIKDLAKDLLKTPKVGLVGHLEEENAIKRNVVDLMTNVMKFVSDLDPKFSVELLQTGSSAEGTRVGEPDEFDFLCILKNFSYVCDIDESGEYACDGFVQLKSNGKSKTEYSEYFGKLGKLDVEKVRGRFISLLKTALSNKILWTNNALYYVDCSDNSLKPVISLDINYVGSKYKFLEISIDIVPAIYKLGWWPTVSVKDSAKLMNTMIRQRGCAVLLQHPEMNRFGCDDENFFRISCVPAELELFQHLPDCLKRGYALAKILIGKITCPSIQFSGESNSIPGSEFISSYMLKNCLFYSIAENCDLLDMLREGLSHCEDTDEVRCTETVIYSRTDKIQLDYNLRCHHDQVTKNMNATYSEDNIDEIIRITGEIFRHLAIFSLNGNLPSYFLPSAINIFNFEYMIIYNQEENELHTTSRYNSLRRLTFISFIMHILGIISANDRTTLEN